MTETWKDVTGYEGLYQVSDAGRVRNARTGALKAARPDSDGYLITDLYQGGVGQTLKIHRMVAIAFLDAPAENELHVDHKNRRRGDNRLANLRWSSVSQNLRNARRSSQSGLPGVRYREGKPNPWQAYCTVGKKFKSIGHYATAEAAVAAREAFERTGTHG